MFETKITYLETPDEELIFHGVVEASTEIEARKKSLSYAVTFSEKCKDFMIDSIVDREGMKQTFNEKNGTVEYHKLDEYGGILRNVSIMIRLEPLKSLTSSGGVKGFHSFPEIKPQTKGKK